MGCVTFSNLPKRHELAKERRATRQWLQPNVLTQAGEKLDESARLLAKTVGLIDVTIKVIWVLEM
jgi:hypothetical protein